MAQPGAVVTGRDPDERSLFADLDDSSLRLAERHGSSAETTGLLLNEKSARAQSQGRMHRHTPSPSAIEAHERFRVEACAGDSRAEIANPVAHAAAALTESTRPDLSDPHPFLACAPAQKQAPAADGPTLMLCQLSEHALRHTPRCRFGRQPEVLRAHDNTNDGVTSPESARFPEIFAANPVSCSFVSPKS
jgi:hypothetical protein